MSPFNPETSISEYFRLTQIQKDALKKLGIETLEDLLYHFPVRYGDIAEIKNIDTLQKGDQVVVFGKISHLKINKGFKTKITMATATVEDDTGSIQCVWFNQPYIAKMIPEGAPVRIEGKVSERRKNSDLYLSNPKIEIVDKLPTGVGNSLFTDDGNKHNLYPIYPESRGISSLWMYHAIQKIFKSGILDDIEDALPGHLLVKYHLPSLKTALIWIHTPLKHEDALSARKRFSFEEILTIQLGRQKSRREYRSHTSFKFEIDKRNVNEFISRFPFRATRAQIRAIENIIKDFEGDQPMSRLLEGDVGSGKTAVAATTVYAIITAKSKSTKSRTDPQPPVPSSQFPVFQVAYMCPTEILATQHFESFIRYFSYMPIRIALITSSGCKIFPSKVNPKSWTNIARSQLIKWIKDGSVAVVVGTHSLIQKSVEFRNLAYVIIDEQHRFGTAQRARLVNKNFDNNQTNPKVKIQNPVLSSSINHVPPRRDEQPLTINYQPSTTSPHLLSMTATPIPRTLTLTLYGDLDLTILDEMPADRKAIITELVPPENRELTYEKIRRELRDGRQVYVICPRIDEPDPEKELVLNAKSVKEEAKRLKRDVFPEYEIGVLHGKMRPTEKDEVMELFNRGTIQILCATSVVEVGVNIANATVIIIEGAERFGLAQLHQLRGRVIRSSHQAYCYTFTNTSSTKSLERLKALQTAKNGFELAELDLAQRGAGDLRGLRQWGISDVAMEALKNIKMVEMAREEAIRLVNEDSELSKYPKLKTVVDAQITGSHFE